VKGDAFLLAGDAGSGRHLGPIWLVQRGMMGGRGPGADAEGGAYSQEKGRAGLVGGVMFALVIWSCPRHGEKPCGL